MARAMMFHRAGEPLTPVVFPVPVPQGREIVVRVSYCTLCRSDLHTHSGRRIEPSPTVLGHEIVGTIHEFGPEADHTDAAGQLCQPGLRVTWSVAVGCGRCYFCHIGLPQKCETPWKYGHRQTAVEQPTTGGLSEYVVLVPNTVWYAIPDTVPDPIAVLANCSTATAVAGVKAAGEIRERTVVVLGAGVLGLTACAIARNIGARQVFAVDAHEESAVRAREFGATESFWGGSALVREKIISATAGRGADAVLEMAGPNATCQLALDLVRTGGTVVFLGSVAPVEPIPLLPEQLIRRMLTLRGVHNYHPHDLGTALEFLAKHGTRHPFHTLVDAEYRLDQIESAFNHAQSLAGKRVGIVLNVES